MGDIQRSFILRTLSIGWSSSLFKERRTSLKNALASTKRQVSWLPQQTKVTPLHLLLTSTSDVFVTMIDHRWGRSTEVGVKACNLSWEGSAWSRSSSGS